MYPSPPFVSLLFHRNCWRIPIEMLRNSLKWPSNVRPVVFIHKTELHTASLIINAAAQSLLIAAKQKCISTKAKDTYRNKKKHITSMPSSVRTSRTAQHKCRAQSVQRQRHTYTHTHTYFVEQLKWFRLLEVDESLVDRRPQPLAFIVVAFILCASPSVPITTPSTFFTFTFVLQHIRITRQMENEQTNQKKQQKYLFFFSIFNTWVKNHLKKIPQKLFFN